MPCFVVRETVVMLRQGWKSLYMLWRVATGEVPSVLRWWKDNQCPDGR